MSVTARHIHIGKLIEAELQEQRRTASWLAEQLCCHRSNIYKIIDKENIDLLLLIRISQILRHDFLKQLSEEIGL